MLDILRHTQQLQCFQISQNSLTGFLCSHAGIFAAVQHFRFIRCGFSAAEQFLIGFQIIRSCHMAVIGKAAHHRQLMPQTNLKVIRVMRRSDFYHTGSLFHVGVFITYNGDLLVNQRQNDMTAMQMLITGIFTVNGYGCITQHGFGTGRGNFQIFSRFLDRIENMPEMTRFFLIFHLGIGNRGLTFRTPVNHSVATINAVLLIQIDKDIQYGFGTLFIHRKVFSFPVAGRT